MCSHISIIHKVALSDHFMVCFVLQPKFQSFFGPGVVAEIGKSLIQGGISEQSSQYILKHDSEV